MDHKSIYCIFIVQLYKPCYLSAFRTILQWSPEFFARFLTARLCLFKRKVPRVPLLSNLTKWRQMMIAGLEKPRVQRRTNRSRSS